MAVGIFQHSMTFSEAGKVYALLTIGDGLVAQLPSLLLSTAAAIMVTRASGSEDMGKQINRQMFASPKALAVSAGLMAVMGIVPGMPHFSFLSLAAVAGGAAYLMWKKQNVVKVQALQEVQRQQDLLPSPARAQETKELGWDDVTPIDMIGLEVGYRLIPLVDRNQGGQLLARIKGVRKKLSQDLGFLMPTVHIRDNLDLAPSAYRLTLMGVILAEAEIYPDRELAINPGQVFGTLNGITAKDPAFGLEAVWIEVSQRSQAQSLGYTVVDASTVVTTGACRAEHRQGAGHQVGAQAGTDQQWQAISLVCADEVNMLSAIEMLTRQTLPRHEEQDFEPEHRVPETDASGQVIKKPKKPKKPKTSGGGGKRNLGKWVDSGEAAPAEPSVKPVRKVPVFNTGPRKRKP